MKKMSLIANCLRRGRVAGFIAIVLPASAWATSANWTGSAADGDWNNLTNWDAAVPQNPGDSAAFGVTTSLDVSLNGNKDLGSLSFNGASYSIAAGTGGSLVLGTGQPSSTILDQSASDTILAPVVLDSTVSIQVANPGDVLSISGNISGNGGISTLFGGGTVSLTGNNTYQGLTTVKGGTLSIGSSAGLPANQPVINNAQLNIVAGNSISPVVISNLSGAGGLTIGNPPLAVSGTIPASFSLGSGYLRIASGGGASTTSSLTINAGATLDITKNNTLLVNYSGGTDPRSIIQGYLQSAYTGGSWQGTGLISTVVEAQVAAAKGTTNGVYSLGYSDGNSDGTTGGVTANQILITPELAADANMDGKVDFNDLLILAQNNGSITGDWTHGDFNYDSKVDFNDLLLLAQNINKTNGNTLLTSELPLSFDAQWKLALAEVHAASIASPVPEPGTLSLFAFGACGLLTRRTRKASSAK